VGLLAIRIFGASEQSEAFALALGQILQRINILRDIEEDAERGRIYVPQDVWGGAEPLPSAAQLLAQPSLIDEGLLRFRNDIDARLKALHAPRQDRLALLPAFAMLGVYVQLYKQLPERRQLSRWGQCKGVSAGVRKMVR
jgi:phytoene/squalene synthetase